MTPNPLLGAKRRSIFSIFHILFREYVFAPSWGLGVKK